MLAYEGNAIVYRERPLPWGLRLFIIVLAFGVGLGVPAPFVIHADWSKPSPVLILVLACIIFSAMVGAFFLLMGLASATELRFDPATRRVWRRLRGPVVNRQDSFAFADIPPPKVIMRPSEDGPFAVLRVTLPGWWRRLDMACFDSRAQADRWCNRIAQMVAD